MLDRLLIWIIPSLVIHYLRPSMEFNELIVNKVVSETDSCVSVSFDLSPDLTDAYKFVPGQYLTLEADIDGEKVRRSYSICSHPNEPLTVAIKQVKDGLFSTWANTQLTAGMKIQVAQPEGNFTHESRGQDTNRYVAFVAGSGITPVLSILKSVLEEEPSSTFTLFYGNKRTQDIIFREEIEGLKNQFMGRLQIYHILSREKTDASILSGRINAENCKSYFDYFVSTLDVSKIFLCGPYDMIMSMKAALEEIGIPHEKVKFELFYNPEVDASVQQTRSETEIDHERIIQITLDGLTTKIKSHHDIPILDMAVETGMDLPYSCKGGVCATCKAKVVEGQVHMTTNFALEKEEVEEGYVLTCQSHVKSDFVHVNFDV